jgi:spore coat polysaccharide biosynthesis protein SpsF
LDHEHVSLHMRNHPEIFPHLHLIAPPSLHWPELGLTLDEDEDYLLIKKIFGALHPANPRFGCLDVIQLLKKNPDWLAINRHVQRKGTT